MANDATHIAELICRSLDGSATLQEKEELTAWAGIHPRYRELMEQLQHDDQIRAEFQRRHPERLSPISEELYGRIRTQLGWKTDQSIRVSAHRVHFLKTAWFRYAAVIIILFGIGAYLWNNYTIKPKPNTAVITPSPDILPGGQKATLTLADGRQIILDSAGNGQLAIENGNEIIKRSGEIIYGSLPIPSNGGVPPGATNPNSNSSYPGGGVGPTSYNTMRTPNGGQYQLTLSDGTKVWLNAASSITFPTVFNGNTREVKIEGEVYFEVKNNKSKPFIVNTGNDKVTVLGTAFNINNYSDEPAGKISLINGAIKVNEKLLQPGQAYIEGKIIQTNIEQDVAWKNGAFSFERTDLSAVLRQLSRWYDITIVYPNGPVSKKITGSMGRDLTLQETLKGLKALGVKGTVEGKKLIINQ